MTARYFKLVALHPDPDWFLQEFYEGRVRFGWSGPGLDLRRVRGVAQNNRTEEERIAWRYTRFLLERIQAGDRLVVQTRTPLREVVIGEVTAQGYDFDGHQPDFNHFLHIRPLTPRPVPISTLDQFLRHDLSKRGQYYQIYPERSVASLDRLLEERPWQEPNWGRARTTEDEFSDTRSAILSSAVKEISRRWPAKAFEEFCARLCSAVPFIEVSEKVDRKKGWDLLIRIVDPLTREVLPGYDDVPVQCKNFVGEVRTHHPVSDLRRCFGERSDVGAAYLFILGELTASFREEVLRVEAEIQAETGRAVALRIVEQDQLAELYLRFMVPADAPGAAGADA